MFADVHCCHFLRIGLVVLSLSRQLWHNGDAGDNAWVLAWVNEHPLAGVVVGLRGTVLGGGGGGCEANWPLLWWLACSQPFFHLQQEWQAYLGSGWQWSQMKHISRICWIAEMKMQQVWLPSDIQDSGWLLVPLQWWWCGNILALTLVLVLLWMGANGLEVVCVVRKAASSASSSASALLFPSIISLHLFTSLPFTSSSTSIYVLWYVCLFISHFSHWIYGRPTCVFHASLYPMVGVLICRTFVRVACPYIILHFLEWSEPWWACTSVVYIPPPLCHGRPICTYIVCFPECPRTGLPLYFKDIF